MSMNQLSMAGVTSFSSVQLLQNFQRVSESYDKVIHFTEDCQWTLFQKSFVLRCKKTQCFYIIDPKFKTTTLQAGDDQALWTA